MSLILVTNDFFFHHSLSECSNVPHFHFFFSLLLPFSSFYLMITFFFSFWQFDEAVTPETFCRNRTLTPSEVSPQMLNSSFWKKKKRSDVAPTFAAPSTRSNSQWVDRKIAPILTLSIDVCTSFGIQNGQLASLFPLHCTPATSQNT